MAGMADQDDLAALAGIAAAFGMDFGDQRAGRVDHRQVAFGGGVLHLAGDAVGGEHRDRAIGDFGDFIDKDRTTGAEVFDDVAVVNDFVADVDRRAEFDQGALDDFDGALDAGAEAARLGEHDFHGGARIVDRVDPCRCRRCEGHVHRLAALS
jgi:hypothetical protein